MLENILTSTFLHGRTSVPARGQSGKRPCGDPAARALTMLCTPVTPGPARYRVLCLISRTAGAFDDQAQDLAAVFAGHPAIALAGNQSLRQLREALSTRDMSGQAQGIMERYDVTLDSAFAVLARVSRQTNLKLRDVAAERCRTGDLRRVGPAPQCLASLARSHGPTAA